MEKAWRSRSGTTTKTAISDLPDPVLCHVLDFLPTADAFRTSILSRRWKHLLASSPTLNLDDACLGGVYDHYAKNWPSFISFVYRMLAVRNASSSSSSRIDRFCLSVPKMCDQVWTDDGMLKIRYPNSEHIQAWISAALLHSVREIKLEVSRGTSYHPRNVLPPELFRCATLELLKIGSSVRLNVPEPAHLPRLRVLHLDRLEYANDPHSLKNLISGCHSLEELYFYSYGGGDWDDTMVVDVSNSTLKTLIMDISPHVIVPRRVVINAPRLQYLQYNDMIAQQYTVTTSNSLIKADIRLAMRTVSSGSHMSDFLEGISPVKYLYLSAPSLEAAQYTECRFPLFLNLIHLRWEFCPPTSGFLIDWKLLQTVLKSSPNLRVLVFFRGSKFELLEEHQDDFVTVGEDVPPCLSFHLQQIEMRMFTGTQDELLLVKYLLETAMVLKDITIQFWSQIPCEHKPKIAAQLLDYKRSSSICKVKLI